MAILERTESVPKSATADPGQRTKPPKHFETTRIEPTLMQPKRITLVDDVITMGSTMVGMYPHLRHAFPEAGISCFALIRTMSQQEVQTILAPVKGTIHYDGHALQRRP